MITRTVTAAVAVLAAAALAACSSDSQVTVRTGGPASSATSSTVASSASGSATPSAAPSTAGKQTAKVTPATGLTDHQKVRVSAAGFTPGKSLQVIECADKGTSTGPGDCNLESMSSVSADSAGRIDTQFEVVRGPFGGNKIVCGAAQKCLISVTEASLSPTEEADAPIEFAG